MLYRVLASVVALLLVAESSRGAETLWSEVVVRVYDTTGAPAGDRQTSLALAGSIVSTASVDVIWRVCDRDARSVREARTHPCNSPLGPNELALRLVRSRDFDQRAAEMPLGNAFIDREAGTGVLATVYLDRVGWMAAQSGTDRRALLGRAIAHELCHLLMATRDHATAGLMRAVWSRVELRRDDARDWSLSAADVALIQNRAKQR